LQSCRVARWQGGRPDLRTQAIQRFQRSSFRGQISDLLGGITGGKRDLVEFHEVARQVRARQQREMGTQIVPLDKIVGSVGRYKDFTRRFLPRHNINQERWTQIDAALNDQRGLPPVELYKIGEVYFVRDGNHRISVARANNLPDIEAYVTELQTNVPLTEDDFTRDRWIIKAEYIDFIGKTGLDQLRPEQDVHFTEPGRYRILLRHIEVHRYLHNQAVEEGIDDGVVFSWEESVVSWYDTVYMPIVETIRKEKILEHFPKRTEADLYLWVAHHRERLARHYELAPLSAEAAVTTFASTHSERPLEHAMQGLRMGLRRALHHNEIPLGMGEEEFQDLRERHDAGEITLAEAEGLKGNEG